MKHMTQFDFFCTEGENIKHQQTGTIRTNCLDCLDRTNATQTMIGMEVSFSHGVTLLSLAIFWHLMLAYKDDLLFAHIVL